MKKVIICVVLIFSTTKVYSQHGWTFQNPIPTANPIKCIKFLNDSTGFFVGDYNTIFKTTNSGINWINISSPLFADYNAIQILNPNTSIVTGHNKVIKTTNGGYTWYVCYSGGGLSLHFLNNNTGFLLSRNSNNILKTTDAGENWFTIGTSPDYPGKIIFINENTGFFIRSKIFKTTNGGSSWIQKTNGSSALHDIVFINQTTGICTGMYGYLVKTTDGGENWNIKNTNTTTGLVDIFHVNENLIYSSGGSTVIKSSNGGETWSAFVFNPNPGIESIYFINSTTGYLAGNFGRLFKTTDGGESWNNEQKSIWNLNIGKVFFPSITTGYVLLSSSSRFVGKTTNSGLNWYVLPDTIQDFHFPDNNIGYSIKNQTLVYKTLNGGLNWFFISNLNLDQNQIYFLNINTGFVGGTEVRRTTNGGQNWNAVNISINSYNSIFFFDNNIGYMVAGSSIFKTTDAGNNWTLIFTYLHPLKDIHFPVQNTGYVIGYYGGLSPKTYVLKTTNGGNNWTDQIFNFSSSLESTASSIHFINSNTGLATLGKSLLVTTNSGLNWFMQASLTGGLLTDECFINQNTGYVVGGGGTILKTTNFGEIITSLNNFSNTYNIQFSLHQNYPNPFNPSTKIKFDIPKGSLVRLKVYDMLGREVAELVNEKLSAGVYEYEWNGAGLPSGVYFYRLQAGEFIETRRMVLVK